MKQKIIYMLMIILVLTVFFQCSRDHSEALSSEMTRELALLPSSAVGLGYLNIKGVKKSPFYAMVKKNLEENPFYSDDYQEFMEATGMDIREDIDELYFSMNPLRLQTINGAISETWMTSNMYLSAANSASTLAKTFPVPDRNTSVFMPVFF